VTFGERGKYGRFESPPNFALEIGDVVTFDSGWAGTSGPWRVETFTELFGAQGARRFYQRVTVRGTT
jgi:hypothetical protein